VEYSNFSNFSIKESNYIESSALKNSAVQVYSSEWAAHYVINNYTVDRKKVFVVPFGANIDFVPERKDLFKDYKTELKLLFVGKNWIRKGGDIVLEAYKILRRRGCNISLTILGSKPKINFSDSKLEVIPFLNKNND